MFRQILTATALLLAAGLAQAGEAARIVFVAGKVEVAGTQLALGGAVQEGDDIATGADGYLYLKTIDDGFLILRPNSRARIVAYHVDPKQPANTRIKLELDRGVARAISGEGAKQAKQNFRFNTPVAAIGVRGTDFTVYTDQETSRVAVISGGVVVSGFTGSCGPEGSGPCEGSTSKELFARQTGQVLQVTKGQASPQFLPASSNAPDMVAPPRSDEPATKTSSTTVGTPMAASLDLDPQKTASLQTAVQTPQPVAPEPARTIQWGRWQTVLDQASNIDISKLRSEGARLIALGDQLALLRTQAGEWQIPNTGILNFGLRESAAYINEEGRGLYVAKVENGRLQVDFGKQTFSTGFDLVNETERFKLQAQGGVTKDGLLLGDSQLIAPTNMAVNGVVAPDKGGTAAYLFQSRIDATRLATGATYWTK
ncbi:FecR family protein [Noviherbaspirillum sp. ST9]|uniref:FecR family protein n=1 Tax=Noviherbaspirillum sp. ST9 TaxID=3401606 RepID=UPI003B586B15